MHVQTSNSELNLGKNLKRESNSRLVIAMQFLNHSCSHETKNNTYTAFALSLSFNRLSLTKLTKQNRSERYHGS